MKSLPKRYAKLVSATIAFTAAFFVYESLNMPLGTFTDPSVGFVPLFFWGGVLLLTLFALVAPEPVEAEETPCSAGENTDDEKEKRKLPRSLQIMIVLGLMIFAFEHAGFFISFLCGVFLLVYVVERKPFGLSLMVSLGLCLGLYLIFCKVFLLDLPSGWLGFL